jgi:Ca-activated chloride channel family protein
VTDLTRTDFVVTENKHGQELVSFSHENAPISLGIIFDFSGSMAKKMAKARTAIEEFLNNLDPEDEEFLVTFSDTPELVSGFASDPAAAASNTVISLMVCALLSTKPRRGVGVER